MEGKPKTSSLFRGLCTHVNFKFALPYRFIVLQKIGLTMKLIYALKQRTLLRMVE